MTSRNKNGCYSVGTLYRRGWRFDMIGMEKLQDIFE